MVLTPQSSQTKNTYVVELTPPGRAAIAVVLVAGPQALRAVNECFVPFSGRLVERIPIGQIALGRWRGGEELIFCRRGAEQVEIHCHGGVAAVEAVVEGLVLAGCKTISWQEWTRQRSPDRIRAAARIALADAMTERTAAILLDQFNGALTDAISEIIGQIESFNWNGAGNAINRLLSRRELGLHLTKPWRVVICGATNVGKSSLINALAGFDRAIVSPQPGTTRDVVTVTTAIDGWPVQLADTAGFRSSPDELESAGMELAAASLAGADLAICIYDAMKLDDGPSVIATKLELPARTIHVVNKIDLVPIARRPDLLANLAAAPPSIRVPKSVSALTGEGIADLMSAISQSVVPAPAAAGSAVPFATDQIEALDAARTEIASCNAAAAVSFLQAMLTKTG